MSAPADLGTVAEWREVLDRLVRLNANLDDLDRRTARVEAATA